MGFVNVELWDTKRVTGTPWLGQGGDSDGGLCTHMRIDARVGLG